MVGFDGFADEEGSSCDGGNSANVRKDLSDWQETHAMLVLSRVKVAFPPLSEFYVIF